MFFKRKETATILIGTTWYKVPKEVSDRIDDLEKQRDQLKKDVNELVTQLKLIKPVLESKELKPALSNRCKKCKYSVKSRYNGEVLGCIHDAVCSDYSDK